MRLNELTYAPGARSKRKRVGRGIASGLGKTCGRGHKGQHSRSGGYHKVGFEGGQMPLRQRVPKFGFLSRKSRFSVEVRLSELQTMSADVVDLATLIAENIVPLQTQQVKIILSGVLTRALTVRGVKVTSGARAAIEQAGGSIDDTGE